MRMRRILISAVALLLAMLFISVPVFAAPSAETQISTSENTDAVFDFDAWSESNGEIHVEEFMADHFLKGLFTSMTENFHVGEWTVHGARLVLLLSSTQLMRAGSADITVSLNEQPIYSGLLPDANGEVTELTIPLPAQDIKTDATNTVTVTVYMRADNDDPCIDYASGATWMNIFKESHVDTAYTALYAADSIASVYTQLTSIDALDNGRSAICVSGSSEGALTAAAWASMGLAGNAVLNYTKLGYESTDAIGKKPYVLYVCDTVSMLPDIKALLSERQLKEAQTGAAAVLLRYNKTDLLLLFGNDDAALENGGRMLANSAYVAQLDTKYLAIRSSDDFAMEEYRVEQYVPLTESGTFVYGSFRQNASFYIYSPANRTAAFSSELSLDVRYSENINFARSLVTVFVNDIPMGSKRLTKEGANGMNIVLPFPDDAEITGSFTIKVAFDLEAEDDWCRLSREELPWGFVSPSSMLKLESMDVNRLLFDHYPSPFVRDGSVNQTVFVLPDDPGTADIGALCSVAAGFGRFLKDNRGTLWVKTASRTDTLSAQNVIYIGAAGKSAAQSTAGWPLSFSGVQLVSNTEKLKIDPTYGSSLGLCALLVSPEDGAYSLMTVSGSSDGEMLSAAKLIGDADLLWKLSGDTFIVSRGDDKANCYTFADPVEEPFDNTGENVLVRETVNVLLVAGLTLLLCATALIILFVRMRRSKA